MATTFKFKWAYMTTANANMQYTSSVNIPIWNYPKLQKIVVLNKDNVKFVLFDKTRATNPAISSQTPTLNLHDQLFQLEKLLAASKNTLYGQSFIPMKYIDIINDKFETAWEAWTNKTFYVEYTYDDLGYDVSMYKKNNVPLQFIFREYTFSNADIQQYKTIGYTANELKSAGLQFSVLFNGGYSLDELLPVVFDLYTDISGVFTTYVKTGNSSLINENTLLKTANISLTEENTSLKNVNTYLTNQNSSFKTVNISVNSENTLLKTANTSLTNEISSLKTVNASLTNEISSLKTINSSLTNEISSLKIANSSLITKIIPLSIPTDKAKTVQHLILGYMDNILYLTDANIVKANKIEEMRDTLRKRDREIAKQNQTIQQQKDEISTLLEVRDVVQLKPAAIRLGIFPIYN